MEFEMSSGESGQTGNKFLCRFLGSTISLSASSESDAMFSNINIASTFQFVTVEIVSSIDSANEPFLTGRAKLGRGGLDVFVEG